MLTAMNHKHQQVFAQHASKSNQYYCPVCQAPVILRNGQTKVAHFAHRTHCRLKSSHPSESLEHLRYKHHIYQQCCMLGYDANMEVWLPDIQQIPDILVQHTAIEVQLSPISIKEIQQRTAGLNQLGYRVIWITRLPNIKRELFQFSQLHQTLIDHNNGHLICIDPINLELKRLAQLIPITAKQFNAKVERISIKACLDMTLKSQYINEITVRKLSSSRLLDYLFQCRRKNSVLEPTLSLAYRLHMTDAQILKVTGFLFPEQLYFQTHPVLWQLQVLYCHKYQLPIFQTLKSMMKIRYFYQQNINIDVILELLIKKYCKILQI
ncbi:competence protein CoiA [Staphylococcus canis]|uniref:Competence protein CoiA n=1 Tax=Staphylococcus canis TaxID=2724942 RepID=A0ABS0T938_9STAP|nr:competence protein CoiA family protein [Staphylococcus canis]MBI5975278.1 competence protein CoiA [Staphylococcus canis]